MKVTYNWLKDFLDIRISPQILADKLTMAGLEVTSLDECDGDFVFEIEVTSNRPDCLSVIGIAREIAAITNQKLKSSCVMCHVSCVKDARRKTHDARPIAIKVEDKKDCPLYTAKIITDVKVGPSPDWLKKRLELIGCRSVNNIVDITNYIQFSWGEPLHTFDIDKLNGKAIIVRRAKNGERLTTIDACPRILNSDILVIADKERPVAIAGIMGSKDCEVTKDTQSILLEAAVFNPLIVRRARQKLGLNSESAYRFERGVNLEIVQNASWQAIGLIQENSGGRCILSKEVGLTKPKKTKTILDVASVSKILGVGIPPSTIKSILKRLEFKLRPLPVRQAGKTKNNFIVGVPSHRLDVNLACDLIEEIARIYGYERIGKTLPRVSPCVTTFSQRDLISLIKNILVGLDLHEVITYSLIDKAGLENAIEILNPLSKDEAVLRSTLIPSLLKAVASNLNQKLSYINIFEIAKIFSATSDGPQEELTLGIALSGIKTFFASGCGLIKEEVGPLHLKGILEALFGRLGIKDYNFNPTNRPSEITVYINQQNLGWMGQFDIKNKSVFVAEVCLDKLCSFANLEKRFLPLPIYPSISRDISLILKENVRTGDLLEAIREKGRPILKEAKIIDYYKGKPIPSGSKGLTISCLYRSDDHTLTEAEVNPVDGLIRDILANRFGVTLR